MHRAAAKMEAMGVKMVQGLRNLQTKEWKRETML
jgi:hypothetical protein